MNGMYDRIKNVFAHLSRRNTMFNKKLEKYE